MRRLTPYGMSNFESIILEKRYFIDKTSYIEKLEQVKYPVFLRPRRFGKTLFTEMLRWYYDIKTADRFQELFGELYIGKNPTLRHNTYFFLKLDFSGMGAWIDGDRNFIKKQFDSHILISIFYFFKYYQQELKITNEYIESIRSQFNDDSAGALNNAIDAVNSISGKMFIAIDEYDSLTNAMALLYQDASESDNEYLNILKKGGFFRGFFEVIKRGTATAVDQVYITGILPITIADMNSGFNIASWITFDRNFSNMLGITQSEFDSLIDSVYENQVITILSKELTKEKIKNYYNGYKFSIYGENVYNPMMTMYFIYHLSQNYLPDNMIDNNLRIDYNQISYIFGNNVIDRDNIIRSITDTKTFQQIGNIQVSFDMNTYKEGKYISEGLYYAGILTFSEQPDILKIPNLVTYEFMLNYFNRIMKFNTGNVFIGKIANDYALKGDVKSLIERFFMEVIQNYPGDFFKNANESFYHGLFFYVLWNSFAKDRYEVLPEFQLTNGQIDIMIRSFEGANVNCPLNDLFEIKCLPKSASEKTFKSELQKAVDQMKNYRTGQYANWRGIVVCFRGNLDYLMEVLE